MGQCIVANPQTQSLIHQERSTTRQNPFRPEIRIFDDPFSITPPSSNTSSTLATSNTSSSSKNQPLIRPLNASSNLLAVQEPLMAHSGPSSGGFSSVSSGGVGDLASSGKGVSEDPAPIEKNSQELSILTEEEAVNEQDTNKYATVSAVNLQFMIK